MNAWPVLIGGRPVPKSPHPGYDRAIRQSEERTSARTARRLPRHRPHIDGFGPLGHHDAGRPGRRRDQGGSDRPGRSHADGQQPLQRTLLGLSERQPQQALDCRQSEGSARARRGDRPRRACRRLHPEFPAGRGRATGGRRARHPDGQPRDRLCLDQWLRRDRALCAQAGLRSDHPGGLWPGVGPGRFGRCAPPSRPHDIAR